MVLKEGEEKEIKKMYKAKVTYGVYIVFVYLSNSLFVNLVGVACTFCAYMARSHVSPSCHRD